MWAGTSGAYCAPEVPTPSLTSLRKCISIKNDSNGLFLRVRGHTKTSKVSFGERVPEAIQDREAALIVDGIGTSKSGDESVGVARQWCGATGKLDNCQVTVNCTLARPGERQNADQLT
ncbi:MAG: hypothetical protein J07HQW1_01824 [Haloquadratum walsbyi J07HQW1]|uniref:Transposase IS701-like DDE domain-containing protein n=1 Tax=Haloquadratum walsbyi J07HQW1 TaxID=1238424 RepID=U1N5A8_9EURY|nr:MAG: hypothetical protein J07HQW1_01824 [Haloquadratum walsbyi J07HQW1]